jgi:hypothetical protein
MGNMSSYMREGGGGAVMHDASACATHEGVPRLMIEYAEVCNREQKSKAFSIEYTQKHGSKIQMALIHPARTFSKMNQVSVLLPQLGGTSSRILHSNQNKNTFWAIFVIDHDVFFFGCSCTVFR